MPRKKKEFNKYGTFQTRFRTKFYESNLTQEALAKELGVSRPTVFGWFEGKNLPDILSLEKIARYFGVSADFLLGLSDVESPDISTRAAVEYTGLSEGAVERLHNGLFDSAHAGEGVFDRKKKSNLRTASALIQSEDFTKMIDNLHAVAREAYMEEVMTLLVKRYFETAAPIANSKFCYANDEERNVVVANLIQVLKMIGTRLDKKILKTVPEMSDREIVSHVYGTLNRVEHANELHQFHATKAFTGYIDQLVKNSCKEAERRFEGK